MRNARTLNPTKKELSNRLTHIREKLSTLRQEEDKIHQKLSHEYAQSLSKYLMDANAIEIDFNVLLGGMLEVITQAQKNLKQAEVWQKAGQLFCRHQRRAPTSIAEERTIQREGKSKPLARFTNMGDDKGENQNEQ